MSIWVRSQNKKRLICCDGFSINDEGVVLGFQGANDEGVVLGKYRNSERALEIIGYINNLITKDIMSDYIFKGTKTQAYEVFVMPNE